MRSVVPVVVVMLCGCATTRAQPADEPEPPRSSVDVLLRRGVELKLTEAQRAGLLEIDEKREGRAERLRVDLKQKYLDVTSGDNENRSSNRGSRAGAVGYELERRQVVRRLNKLDREALKDAEALLEAEQVSLGRTYLERYRLERSASVQDDGE